MKRRLLAIAGHLGHLALGPIQMKEVRGTFRTRRFFLSQLIPMLIIGAVLMVVYLTWWADASVRLRPERIGKTIYGFFFVLQSALLILVIPAFCCTAITEERERKTFDLLITSSLKPWEIVWGKVVASMSYVVTFLLASMPLVFLSFLFGGVSPAMLLICYAILLAQGLMVTVFSIFCSALVRSSKVATVIAYLGVLLGGFFLVMTEAFLVDELLRVGWTGVLDDFAGPKLLNRLFVVGAVPLFGVVSFCTFLFLLAVNRIRPATGNRSTGMRLFLVFFLSGLTAIWLGTVGANRANLGQFLMAPLLAFYIGMSVLLLFGAMAFCCEPLAQSSRLRIKLQKLRGWRYPLRIFGIGSISGSLFHLVLSTLLLIAPLLMVVALFGGRIPANLKADFIKLLTTAWAAWTFFFFLTMLGLFMSVLKVRPLAARCVMFFGTTMILFAPLFHAMWVTGTSSSHAINHPTIQTGHYLSPILSWMAIWVGKDSFSDYQLHFTTDGDPVAPLWAVHIGVYLAVGIILAVINLIRARRVKRRLESSA